MSLSAYNSSSREGAPRLSMLAAIIGALFSNAYASTAPIDIDNTVQVKRSILIQEVIQEVMGMQFLSQIQGS